MMHVIGGNEINQYGTLFKMKKRKNYLGGSTARLSSMSNGFFPSMLLV